MIDELIFDVYISIFYSIGAINLTLVTIKRKDLLKYLPAYILHAVGYIFYTLHHIDYTYRLIANIFFLFTAVFAFIAIYIEYRLTFTKIKTNQPNSGFNLIFVSLNLIVSIIIGLQIVIILILLISIVMMGRIFLVKRAPTYLALILIPSFSLLAIFSAIINEMNIYGSWELSYVITLILTSVILLTPVIAYAEDRLIKSEKKHREAYITAEFYKNLLAHDIRNILQTIGSSYELIKLLPTQNNNNEEVMKYLQIINEQIIRGANLVSNVHKLSQFSEAIVEPKSTEVLEILKKSINFVKNSFSEKNIIIELYSEYDVVNVGANDLILDVFENILINAVKHNKNQKIEIQIYISRILENSERFIKIEFKDNGKGVPDDLKEQIFMSNINSFAESKGLGLGLLLVNKIIHSYNGRIWVEDRIKGNYSHGCNFVILIPEATS